VASAHGATKNALVKYCLLQNLLRFHLEFSLCSYKAEVYLVNAYKFRSQVRKLLSFHWITMFLDIVSVVLF
jgi:hypothetical protein